MPEVYKAHPAIAIPMFDFFAIYPIRMLTFCVEIASIFLIVHIYKSLNNAPALRHFLGWPHFPWNFVSGILAVRKVINHGNPRWCVSSLVDGKRSQRFFRTKEDAHTRATSLRNDPRAGDSTNGALRLSEGPSALQSSRLSTQPPSQAATRFPGHPSPWPGTSSLPKLRASAAWNPSWN